MLDRLVKVVIRGNSRSLSGAKDNAIIASHNNIVSARAVQDKRTLLRVHLQFDKLELLKATGVFHVGITDDTTKERRYLLVELVTVVDSDAHATLHRD
jgi:hypothetical protein